MKDNKADTKKEEKANAENKENIPENEKNNEDPANNEENKEENTAEEKKEQKQLFNPDLKLEDIYTEEKIKELSTSETAYVADKNVKGKEETREGI